MNSKTIENHTNTSRRLTDKTWAILFEQTSTNNILVSQDQTGFMEEYVNAHFSLWVGSCGCVNGALCEETEKKNIFKAVKK